MDPAFTRFRAHLEELVPFTDEEFATTQRLPELIRVKKGEHLFQQGEICKLVAHVDKGCLRYYTGNADGVERILYFAMEGWWIGDLQSFYSNEPSANSLQALEPCELLAFNLAAFEQAKETVPAFRRFLEIKWRRAYTGNQERTLQAMTSTPEERYEAFIKKYPQALERIPLYHIAAYLGVTPEALSRIRARRVAR
jgi:CRP-like cAMP-binding protein